MATRNEVESFLGEFQAKMKVSTVMYVGREKNKQTLLDLQMVPADRDRTLEGLSVDNYSEGPLPPPEPYPTNAWVFGTTIAQHEIYIKICLGRGLDVICISFHVAEHPMQYPLKQ